MVQAMDQGAIDGAVDQRRIEEATDDASDVSGIYRKSDG
jgi:hypothetical protein